MKPGRIVGVLAAVALSVSALIPLGTAPTYAQTYAQNNIDLVLSVTSFWEDVLTPDLLAEFESQYPGVTVHVTFTETGFFGFGPSDNTIDTQLDSAEELVTSADVVYVDSSTLSTEGTQAGYFLDLAPLVMNDPSLDSSDFIPAVWQSFQWDNGMWALPISTDAIVLTYDPAAFDEAGLAYPNERWTIDDFANAARRLTQYNADGTVATAGFTTNSGGSNLDVFLRALAGTGLYDSATMPNAPDFSNPTLEYLLQTWYDLTQEGVVQGQGGGRDTEIPLRVEGINGYAERGFGRNEETTTRYATLLPGGVAGLNVQALAVSAGTQYPELAYELAEFLTTRSELASNMFSVSPARYSLMNSTSTTQNTNDNGQPGAPGGPGGFLGNQNAPEEIQPVIDQGLNVGLPMSELRYASYLSTALTEMNSNGGDALSALQTVEVQAVSDVQVAQARYGTVNLFVTPPETGPTLAPGEITLTCAVNTGMGGGGPMRGGNLFNQDQWDQVIADFVASDPLVGAVTLESVQTDDLATLAETYDCIILPSNVVPDADLSVILNLDPLLDTDPTFDRNDVIGNTLTQLQQDNKTWAMPIAIEPQMLQYTQELFAWAGVPEPVNGWTTDTFTDALRMLKSYDPDSVPFSANDPSGASLLMLIATYGGLPIDYRTDPATINFTDPATVDAIRQVLDLAIDGYISYDGLTETDQDTTVAITSNTFNQFRGGPGRPGEEATTEISTPYPQGSQYGVLAYEITTGYVSATAQNPESAYGFLSAVACNPQLFNGMPARQSLIYDPVVAAAQGEELVSVYQQIDALLRNPNTVVFPTLGGGMGGAGAISFLQQYWLTNAFDNYVLEGADLELELADAEEITLAYLECTNNIVIDTTTASDPQEQMRELGQQIMGCAASVDPTFELGF